MEKIFLTNLFGDVVDTDRLDITSLGNGFHDTIWGDFTGNGAGYVVVLGVLLDLDQLVTIHCESGQNLATVHGLFWELFVQLEPDDVSLDGWGGSANVFISVLLELYN